MRFLLVDRILSLERDKTATGLKNVTMSEDYLNFHFPHFPVMPGMLIAEALVQLADWVIREGSDFQRMGVANSFEQMKFYQLVQPGDQLRLQVQLGEQRDGLAQVKGSAFCDEQRMAMVQFSLTIQPLERYLPPAEARLMYQLLTRTAT